MEREYKVVMATYCFGFAGKKATVTTNDEEAEMIKSSYAKTRPTSIEIIPVTAKNKKDAFIKATTGKSLFAGPFAGIDISKG